MIDKIIDVAFSGFFNFCGMAILLNGLAYFGINGLLRGWVRLTRTIMVSLRGWPPSHLDADGDWNPNQPK